MKRVAIVGCGGIAGVHVRALEKIADCEITALCDIALQNAEKLAEEIEKGGAAKPRLYDDFERMLEQDEADVIHLCTPHYLHVPMAASALQKDRSVFMEKPAAISMEQLEKLQRAEAQSKGALGVCFQNRYNLSTLTLDELVSTGRYGKVLGGRAVVTWRRDEEYYAGSSWKGRWETEGGGVMINQSIHTLDLLLRYLGKPVKIEATLSNHHTGGCIEVEDTVSAWMEFPDGKRGCFYASNGYAADAPVWMELECEKARLTLTDSAVLVTQNHETCVIPCREQAGIGKDYWGSGHLSCIRDFYDCLSSGQRFQNDMDGVYTTALTTLQIYEKGRKTEWNR